MSVCSRCAINEPFFFAVFRIALPLHLPIPERSMIEFFFIYILSESNSCNNTASRHLHSQSKLRFSSPCGEILYNVHMNAWHCVDMQISFFFRTLVFPRVVFILRIEIVYAAIPCSRVRLLSSLLKTSALVLPLKSLLSLAHSQPLTEIVIDFAEREREREFLLATAIKSSF